jgi:hypothetical protein
MRTCVALAAAAVAAAALTPGSARANGDPASDILIGKNVFLSLTEPTTVPSGNDLISLTAQAKKQRFPLKVAVIAARTDLGLVPGMWGSPRAYARFLGGELRLVRYTGTLLVLMPNGAGVFGPGATPRAKAAISNVRAPRNADLDALGKTAARAAVRVAAANGHRLEIPKSSSSNTTIVILAAVLGGAVVVGGAAFFVLRRWFLRQ